MPLSTDAAPQKRFGGVPQSGAAIPISLPGRYNCRRPVRGASSRPRRPQLPHPHEESVLLMLSDPRSVDRLLGYMSKVVWLIMAYSFGTMVGRLILLWQ